MSTTDHRPDALLAGLFDASPDGIVAFDRELRYTAWSPAMERMTGMPAARVLGRVMHELFPFLEAIGERAGAEAALRGETALAPERPFRVAETGEEGWAETRYAPLRDADGRVVGGVATVRDVTGRVRAGEASEERLRALVEATSRMVWSTDASGAASDPGTWLELTGQTPEEIRAGGWESAVHPEDRPRILEAWARARAAGSVYEAEYRLRMRDGEYRWFSARGVPVRGADGGVGGWVGTLEDVHARREAEAGREAERDLLRRVLAQLPAAVAVFEGPEHVFAAVSDRYHRIVGRREVVGRPLAAVLPELAEQGFVALLDGVYATGEPAAGTAVRADWDDDGDGRVEEHLVDYAYHPLRDAAGRVTGVVAHVTDVGERERASRERDEARREAEARAEEAAGMAMQLQEQAAELELQVEESQALAEELQAVNLELTDAGVEAERRAAELRATLEGIPDAVLIGTREGLSLANEAALALFGVGSVEELNAAHASLEDRIRSRDPLTGEPVPLAEQPFARALAGERSVREVVG
ncbi:MAG TPA: PAS domain S-box protein, partial [Longimicrobiaceae bacterium]|nr:PAS domain S-box protein [Longimicrobiaceae bacterium]